MAFLDSIGPDSPAPEQGVGEFGDLLPAPAIDRREQILSAQPDTTFGEAVTAAVSSENTLGSLARATESAILFDDDPDFALDDDLMNELTAPVNGSGPVSPDYFDWFAGATSREHAFHLRAQLEQRLQHQRDLSDYGVAGAGLGLAAAFADPIAIAGSAATAGALAPILAAQKVGRLGRAAVGGATAAAENVAIEAFLANNDPLRTNTDILLAGVVGGVFGSAFSGLSRTADNAAITARTEEIRDQFVASGQPVPREVREAAGPLRARSPQAEAAAGDVVAFRNLSPNHSKVSDALSSANLRPDQAHSVRRVLAAANLDHLDDVSIRITRDEILPSSKGAPTNVVGVTRFEPGGDARIIVRADDEAIESGRFLQTLLHEVGEVRYDRLPSADKGYINTQFRKLADSRQLVPALREVFGEEPGRRISKFGEPNEVFAELYGRVKAADSIDVSRLNGPLSQASPDVRAAVRLNEARAEYPQLDEFLTDVEDLADAPVAIGTRREVFDDASTDAPQQGGLRAGRRGGRLLSKIPHISPITRIRMSESPLLRKAAQHLADDRMPTPGDDLRPLNLQETAERQFNRFMASAQRGRLDGWKAYAKENGWNLITREFHIGKFNRDVTRYLRDGSTPDSPGMAQAVKSIREAYDDGLKYLHDNDLLPEGAARENYVPRIYNYGGISDIRAKHGHDTLVTLIETAMRRANDDIDLDNGLTYREVAETHLEVIERSLLRENRAFNAGIDGATADMVDDILDGTSASAAARAEIRKLLTPEEGAPTDRVKFRLELDEATSIRLDDGSELSITDIFENDSELLTRSYFRDITLTANERQWRQRFATEDDLEAGTLPSKDVIFERIRQENRNLGIQDPKAMNDELEQLDGIYKVVMGHPLDPNVPPRLRLWMDRIRAFNFARIGSAFGLATLPELTAAMLSNGVRGILTLPELAKAFRDPSKLAETDLYQELAAMDIGTDAVINASRSGRRAEDGSPIELIARPVDRVIDRVGNAAAWMGGMTPVTMASERIAAAGVVNRIARTALTDGGSGLTPERLAFLGLSPEDLPRLADQLKANAKFADGGPTKVAHLDIENWADREMADKFTRAVQLKTREIIYKHNPTDTPLLMQTAVGKMLTQFRSFALGSLTNRTFNSLHYADKEAAGVLLAEMLGGVLSATLIAVKNAQTQDDPEAFLADRLRPDRLLLGSLSRTATASILPGMMDTLTGVTMGHKFFSGYRSSNLNQNLITGNPSYDLLFSKIPGAISGVSQPGLRSDRQFSEKDARNLATFTMVSSFPGVRALSNAAIDYLPDSSSQGE